MTWREKAFGPMRERTLENAQVNMLRMRYDLARDSRLAREIVRTVNEELDLEEARRGVRRVRIGELYLRTCRGSLVLPVRTAEALDRFISGEGWGEVRRDLLSECTRRYRRLFPNATEASVRGFLRLIWPGCAPNARNDRERLPNGKSAGCPGARTLMELDRERARQRMERDAPRPGHRAETTEKLYHYLHTQAGIPPAVQEPLLLELMSMRARFYPRMCSLSSGEMPLASMHVDSGRHLWEHTRYLPLAPIAVSVLGDGENRRLQFSPPKTYSEFMDFHSRRLARVMTEAFRSDGLLSYAELQWIFLMSTRTISSAVNYYQRSHGVMLPCPGTILDMGRMLTHKDIIVRLSLEGHSVLEIARKTFHNPRSVDAYLKDFDSVLILHLYGIPKDLMSRTLGKGKSLVQEYLNLIDDYLKRPDAMRSYLQRKGIRLPANVSYSG